MPSERDHTASAAESSAETTITSSIDTTDLRDSEEAQDEGESQSQAFNPETGEINWDCPCLGGMAHGTCGEEFKAAFSCFVYSEEEPKGMDCIEAFKAMQECFRAHPEEYASEIAEDEEGDDDEVEGNVTDTETDVEDSAEEMN
ncbi:Oxidoreductase [Coemansia spiralis]|uniref:Mitochondrial intermembrane space import and assembly protein 40 n=2 Tax=Coemansia TaxID=4863 RepID=A0A9W8G9U2_9FUNG|nr:hypothetical protein BX070DRAFT_227934 [Coemansia spiralis]KAJ1992702.1 Oxidoreductase [Coemansia umbellata]KAJ2623291.1 Oxidoreductase [Coemansia sp. RSA 1358]KAJ2678842.1 Oxidoreductase [Coemansia spiralis]